MTVLNQPAVVSTGALLSSDAECVGEFGESCNRQPVSMGEDKAVWVDITKEFTDACSLLELGVLVHDAKFVVVF